MSNVVEETIGNDNARNRSFLFKSLDEVTKFRVTGIQSAEVCGRYWRMNFLKATSDDEQNDSSNKWTKIGTLIHLLAEDFLLRMSGQPAKLEQSDITQIISALEELEDLKSYQNWLIYQQRLMMYILGGEIIRVEKDVIIPNKIAPLSGQVDLLFRDRNGVLTVLDHKTNRKPSPNHKWKSKFQINAYATSICHEYGVDEVRFIIGNVNQVEDNDFIVRGSVANMNVRINHAINNIKNGAEGVGDNCHSCIAKENGTCPTYRKYLELKG